MFTHHWFMVLYLLQIKELESQLLVYGSFNHASEDKILIITKMFSVGIEIPKDW
jgi:hypothetical protein